MEEDEKKAEVEDGSVTQSEAHAELVENKEIDDAFNSINEDDQELEGPDLETPDPDEDQKKPDEDPPDDDPAPDDDSDKKPEEEDEDKEPKKPEEGKPDKKDDEADDLKKGESDEKDSTPAADEEGDWSELSIPITANKKTSEIKLNIKGELSPQSMEAVKKAFEKSVGLESKMQAVSLQAKKDVSEAQEETRSVNRKYDESIRDAALERNVSSPFNHLHDAIDNSPELRSLIEGGTDPVKALLQKHGWDGNPTHGIDMIARKREVDVQKREIALFEKESGELRDKVVDDYAAANKMTVDEVKAIIDHGFKNGVDFEFVANKTGFLEPPQAQAQYFEKQLKVSHGLAVIEGKHETPGHKKDKSDLGDEKELRQRRAERQKRDNKKLRTASGAPGQPSTGKFKKDEPVTRDQLHQEMVSDPEIDKAFRSI